MIVKTVKNDLLAFALAVLLVISFPGIAYADSTDASNSEDFDNPLENPLSDETGDNESVDNGSDEKPILPGKTDEPDEDVAKDFGNSVDKDKFVEKDNQPFSKEIQPKNALLSASEVSPNNIPGGYVVTGDMSGTYDSLFDACTALNNDGGANYVITVTADDMDMGVIATVNQGKNVALRSGGANINTIYRQDVGRHLVVFGSLSLSNIVIDGRIDQGNQGGGISVQGGTLELHEGSTITHCFGLFGGGINAINSSTVLIDGGVVSYNQTLSGISSSGSGIYLWNNSSLTLSSGSINDNQNASYGGGVFVGLECTFDMLDGTITNNTADVTGSGGGVYVWAHGTLNMSGGSITNNSAGVAGGGVGVGLATHIQGEPTDWSRVIITDGLISQNTAGVQGGGLAAGWTGQIEMDGGTVSYNEAPLGGGVVLFYAQYEDDGVSLVMTGGEICYNSATGPQFGGGGICAYVTSTFSIKLEIGDPANPNTPLIYGNTSTLDGGGIALTRFAAGELNVTINKGEIYNNSAVGSGGGIVIAQNVNLAMHGGTLGSAEDGQGNSAALGGGLASYRDGNTITIDGTSSIINNTATENGGGLHIGTTDTASITALIEGNVAQGDGGGAYFVDTSLISIVDSNVRNNRAAQNGGGLYVEENATLSATGTTSFVGNTAGNEGGGIYTADYVDYANLTASDYQNITLAPTTVFSNNSAPVLYYPPAIASTYTNIGYATSSIMQYGSYINPINNYDINYVSNSPIPFFTITYDPNGGTGSHVDDMHEGGSYTVLDLTGTGIARDNYTFLGWNTAADGSGTLYAPGDTITITADLILYAQWEEPAPPVPPTPSPDPTDPAGGKAIPSSYLAKAEDSIASEIVLIIAVLVAAGTTIALVRRKHNLRQ